MLFVLARGAAGLKPGVSTTIAEISGGFTREGPVQVQTDFDMVAARLDGKL
jgi:hypothetical protein